MHMKESSSKSSTAGQEGKNPCKKHMATYYEVENQLKNYQTPAGR